MKIKIMIFTVLTLILSGFALEINASAYTQKTVAVTEIEFTPLNEPVISNYHINVAENFATTDIILKQVVERYGIAFENIAKDNDNCGTYSPKELIRKLLKKIKPGPGPWPWPLLEIINNNYLFIEDGEPIFACINEVYLNLDTWLMIFIEKVQDRFQVVIVRTSIPLNK